MVISRLGRLLPRQGFVRNVATLAGATALAQVIALAVLPILTRLYTPEAYGTAATFTAIVGLIGVVGALRYEFAIPLPRTDRGAWHLVVLATLILAGVVLATGIVAPWLSEDLANAFGVPSWGFAMLLALGVLTLGAYQAANYWAVRKSAFGAIAHTRIQQGVVGPASQLALGLAGFGALGLIIGQILGQCAGLARLATRMLADNSRSGITVHRRGLTWAMKRYRRFPLYDSWAGLLNVAGAQAPILLLAALFSPVLAGYYALAHRVLSAPLKLVGKAVSQALLPRLVKARHTDEAAQLLEKLLSFLALASLPPFAMVAILAPDIVPVLFGAEWSPAGWMLSWTAIWVGWQMMCSPLSVVFFALEAQKLNTVLQAAMLALRLSPLVVGAKLGSAEIAVIGYSVASAVGYAGYIIALCIMTNIPMRRLVIAVCQPVAFAIAYFTLALMVPMEPIGQRYVILAAAAGLWFWRLRFALRKAF